MFQRFYLDALATFPAEMAWWPTLAKQAIAAWIAVGAILLMHSNDHLLAGNPVREYAWFLLSVCWGVLPLVLTVLGLVLCVCNR